jgi:hypothetical protein
MSCRIKWLDKELTEAILIRGHWWWKRMAPVRRRTLAERAGGDQPSVWWIFSHSELPATAMDWELERQRSWQLANGLDHVDWCRARELAPATARSRKVKPAMRLLP